jgi:ABC-type branched-subunit amino acid transport system substrate-binding protein
MPRALMAIVAALMAITGLSLVAPGLADGAADQSGQGVTPTSIKLGITYLDAAAIRNIVNLDPGDYQVAYTALINQINANGGIDGRKIVPVFEPINPIGTSPAATACTALTEDDKVFAVIGFFQSADTSCYVSTHDTPLIGGTLTNSQSAQAKAAWFNNYLSANDLIPKEMAAFKQEGVFANNKVGVVGDKSDQTEVDLVLSALQKLKVKVVQTALNGVPDTDQAATNSEYSVIAQKFKAAGANVVIAVGDGGVSWPKSLNANQSTYLPRLIVPDYPDLQTVLSSKANYNDAELKGALTAGGAPPPAVEWNDPAMRHCVASVQAAEPNAKINNPVTATASTPVTWNAPENACQELALFEDIVKAAGKTLNNATFNRGGESLTHVTLPGGGGIYDFGPGHHDGNGPVFIYEWNSAANKMEPRATVG